nr:reverse transcriptase domain-containing protein [Tanacetum cinerariifolium]
MHAYYVKESPISSPVIMPPSPMLSPMFNPQEFFLPEELLPPKKRGRDRSSSSTSALPQEFEIRESSQTELQETRAQVAKLQRKQLGQNNKIADRVKMPPKRTSTSAAPAMTQAAIRQLVADSITTSLEAQATNIENANNTNRNPEPRETPIARKCSYKEFMSCQPFNFKDCKVKFATGTLTEEALSWWNSFAQPIGIEQAYKITWVEFKKLLIKKYCPRTEVQKIEDKFYHLTVMGNDLKTYVRRFQELETLCPNMVSDFEKVMEAFIEGLT